MKYIKDGSFDMESWLGEVERYNKNKEYIGFAIKTKYNGKFSYNIVDAGKYKGAVKELYLSLLEGVKMVVVNEYMASSNLNSDEVSSEINESLGEYFCVFTEQGADALFYFVKAKVKLTQTKRIIDELKYVNGNWSYKNKDANEFVDKIVA